MAKLKWDEERQAFKYQILSTRPVPGGNVVYISMEELPAGIKIESRNSQPVSVEVDDAYLKVKLPNLKRLKDLEDAEGATEFLTVEELNAKKEQALSGVADTTPFGEDASRVLNKSFIAQSPNFSRTAEGVGYIAPDALPGTEASMVYIRPGQDARGAMSLDAIDVISAEAGLEQTLENARKQPGGISALKQKLVSSGFYGGELTALAPYSLSVKDMEDDYFVTALASALRSQSILNYGYAKQGRALLDFDSWLKESEAAYSSILSDKTVNLPNPKDARQVFIKNYQRFVGATPDDNTIAAFVASANAYANANPDIITPVVQTGARVVQPGFNEQQLDEFAQEYILQTPQAQEYGMEQGGIDMFSGAIDGLLNELQTSISQNSNVGLQ
jgi:hypothetical protein